MSRAGLRARNTARRGREHDHLGHGHGPVWSGAHFFLTIPVLPYKMSLDPINECQYALGYYRPGNCAPYLFPPVPLSVEAALIETGSIFAGFWILR